MQHTHKHTVMANLLTGAINLHPLYSLNTENSYRSIFQAQKMCQKLAIGEFHEIPKKDFMPLNLLIFVDSSEKNA